MSEEVHLMSSEELEKVPLQNKYLKYLKDNTKDTRCFFINETPPFILVIDYKYKDKYFLKILNKNLEVVETFSSNTYILKQKSIKKDLIRILTLPGVISEQEIKNKEIESIILKAYRQLEKGYLQYIRNEDAQSIELKQTLTSDNNVYSNFFIENYQENVEQFYKTQPFFYDNNKIFWFWNKNNYCYQIIDETDIMRFLDKQLNFRGQTVNSKLKAYYIEAFKRSGRDHTPKNSPKKWIQFKDKAYSIKSGKTYDVTSDFFFTNPIPWELGTSNETPIIDKLFSEWVGEKYVKTLYELIAYCCYTDYPIQLIICLYGHGRNGKSTFLKILNKFLGINNICSTDLDLLSGVSRSRFESFKLFKKLACFMGETNFSVLSSSSLLKKLVGGDMIGFEMKGKNPFDEYNYAKLVIASNSLPSSEDNTEGFYRRWLIIDFPNQFPEGKDISLDIPDSEFGALAKKVCEVLPGLLERGEFTNQGSISDREKKYVEVSNPLMLFINLSCIVSDEGYVKYSDLYGAYVYYLRANKKRVVKRAEFNKILDVEGFVKEKASKKVDDGDHGWINTFWIHGLSLKVDWKDAVLGSLGQFIQFSNRKPLVEQLIGNTSHYSQTSQNLNKNFVLDVKEERVSD